MSYLFIEGKDYEYSTFKMKFSELFCFRCSVVRIMRDEADPEIINTEFTTTIKDHTNFETCSICNELI